MLERAGLDIGHLKRPSMREKSSSSSNSEQMIDGTRDSQLSLSKTTFDNSHQKSLINSSSRSMKYQQRQKRNKDDQESSSHNIYGSGSATSTSIKHATASQHSSTQRSRKRSPNDDSALNNTAKPDSSKRRQGVGSGRRKSVARKHKGDNFIIINFKEGKTYDTGESNG